MKILTALVVVLWTAVLCAVHPDCKTLPLLASHAAPESSTKLLSRHRTGKKNGHAQSEKIRFDGMAGKDVYNPTAPFSTSLGGQQITVIAGRVESRDSEKSEVFFFEKKEGKWSSISKTGFKMQDPFVTRFGNELAFGGVETFEKPGGGLGYRTVFYRGTDIENLKPFAVGPNGMKDVRLLSLPDSRVLIVTRPQGAIGGKGKIGYRIVANLGEVNEKTISEALILEGLFPEEEWGGANELHLLKNGNVGVLGHVARFDAEGNRHYYPMVFTLDPTTGKHSPIKIILERAELPAGESKRKDLIDVLFSGGLLRGQDGKAELWVGAGDAEIYRVVIEDPFAEYEKI